MRKISVLIVLGLLLVGVTIVGAASVEPYPYDNMDHIDAGHICVRELGFDFGTKIEVLGGPGGFDDDFDKGPGTYDDHDYNFDPDFANEISITPPNLRYWFDWAADPFPIGAVVVQGGEKDNIYFYDPAVDSDTELEAYDNPQSPKPEKISHISFCWNKTDDNGEEECYQEETAWADGPGYIDANQWATYVPYVGEELTVDLYAGQNIYIGTATFSAPVDGEVTITINLIDGWIFYYDLGDEELDDNLKVQDYENPPEGNPAIGLFEWKTFVPFGSSEGAIDVPENDYYGVHLDVAGLVECPVE